MSMNVPSSFQPCDSEPIVELRHSPIIINDDTVLFPPLLCEELSGILFLRVPWGPATTRESKLRRIESHYRVLLRPAGPTVSPARAHCHSEFQP